MTIITISIIIVVIVLSIFYLYLRTNSKRRYYKQMKTLTLEQKESELRKNLSLAIERKLTKTSLRNTLREVELDESGIENEILSIYATLLENSKEFSELVGLPDDNVKAIIKDEVLKKRNEFIARK